MKSWTEKVEKLSGGEVANGGGGSPGSVAWEDITGTPTDNTALDALIDGLNSADSALDVRLDSAETTLDGNLTQIAGLSFTANKLLGRGASAMEVVTVGSGLSLSGGTLTATGGGSSPTSIEDLTDVNLTSPVANEFLKYDGDDWINSAINLSGLGEVNIEGIASGQGVIWDGTELVPTYIARAKANVTVLAGTVSSSGVGSNLAGWTVSKMGTGDYRINISPALSSAPNVTVTVQNSSGGSHRVVRIHTISSSAFRVVIGEINFGGGSIDAIDEGFCFVAIGTS